VVRISEKKKRKLCQYLSDCITTEEVSSSCFELEKFGEMRKNFTCKYGFV